MYFAPYVIRCQDRARIPVEIIPASAEDIESTRQTPIWQTDWDSQYLNQPGVEKFAMKRFGGRLLALGAYKIMGQSAFVFILYLESAPESNPTLTAKERREFVGIGEAMLAFGIKYSIDNGCRGDIVFEAKTEELARHYAEDFHALRLPGPLHDGPKRFMLADQEAWQLFSKYLQEQEGEE